MFSLQYSTIYLFPSIVLLFHFIFCFNNINVHQLSWYTCLTTFSTWYRFCNMKVYIAQGSGFLRLVKSDNDTEKNLFWLKKEVVSERIAYEWLHCRYSILMRHKSWIKVLFFLFRDQMFTRPKVLVCIKRQFVNYSL